MLKSCSIQNMFQMGPRRWRQTCTRPEQLSVTRAHSSFGISLIFAVIAAFSSLTFLVVLVHIILEVLPKIKSAGFKSSKCGI